MSNAAAKRTYDFSDDWFSHHIPTFECHLAHLRDKPCRLLEIGSYEGRSAIWLLHNIATHPQAHIDMVDTHDQPRLAGNIAPHRNQVTFHLGPSAEVMRTLPLDSYDFAYVDGSHWTANVLEDAVHAFRLVKAGGVIGFDDYLWDDPMHNEHGRPKEAIDAFLSIYAPSIEVLHHDYQVWIRRTA